MSVAWTTIVIVALLLPGVAFFIGLAIFERIPREVVRSNAISEVGMAIMLAIAIHTIALSTLYAFGFDLSDYVAPLATYEKLAPHNLVSQVMQRLIAGALYVLATAAAGFGGGAIAAHLVVRGTMRILATHKWIYDVIDSGRRRRVVTAYVLTTLSHEGKVLMYRGRLQEFFLTQDGKLSYIVLKNCARYYMRFDDDQPRTGEQLKLFGTKQDLRPIGSWDYLMIEGTNIANVLFDPSPEIIATDEGTEALNQAIEAIQHALRERLPKDPPSVAPDPN